jgi:hypothetical protein
MLAAALDNDWLAYAAMVSSPGAAAGSSAATGQPVFSVLAFHGFNLAWIGALVTAIALTLNWRRRPASFLINSALVALTDLGLLITTVAAGAMTVGNAAPGLVLGGLAVLFAMIHGLRGRHVRVPAVPA